MSIDHCCFDVHVAEGFLHRPDIVAALPKEANSGIDYLLPRLRLSSLATPTPSIDGPLCSSRELPPLGPAGGFSPLGEGNPTAAFATVATIRNGSPLAHPRGTGHGNFLRRGSAKAVWIGNSGDGASVLARGPGYSPTFPTFTLCAQPQPLSNTAAACSFIFRVRHPLFGNLRISQNERN